MDITRKRGKKLVVVRTDVRDIAGRLMIDVTTTHLQAE